VIKMRRKSATGFRTLLRSAPRGGAIVEFALVMPFLVGLAVGLFDLGFGLWQSMQVQAAAEAGAQYASLNALTWNATAIATAVTSATGASGVSATPAPSQVCGCTNSNILTPVGSPTGGSCSSFTCTPSGTAGLYASVSAQASYSPLVPWPWMSRTPTTLTGQAYRRLK
jgi:Flp pilus assembly protein TadG